MRCVAFGTIVPDHTVALGQQRGVEQAIGVEGVGGLRIGHGQVTAFRHRRQGGQAFGFCGGCIGVGGRANQCQALYPFGGGGQQRHGHIAPKRKPGQPETVGQVGQQCRRNRFHAVQGRVVHRKGGDARRQVGHHPIEHRTGVVQAGHQNQVGAHAGR